MYKIACLSINLNIYLFFSLSFK